MTTKLASHFTETPQLASFVVIYALCEPDTKTIRYVGKAKSVSKRMTAHRNEKRGTRKCRWLASLAQRGVVPTLIVLENVQSQSWQKAERKWIARCRLAGYDLTNHTDGGEGVGGLDADARARLSAAMKARMNDPAVRAKIFTPQRSAKLSAALKGMAKTKEHVAKLPQNTRGFKHTEQFRAKLRANSRGHRWTSEELIVIRANNSGKRFNLGNQHTKGRVVGEAERRARSVCAPRCSKKRGAQAQDSGVLFLLAQALS